MFDREWITDPSEILELLSKNRLRLVKHWPFGSYVQDTHGLWRRVPRQLMNAFIALGLVEKDNLGFGAGSWIYRRRYPEWLEVAYSGNHES